jgi:hypothetical protein
MGVVAMKEKLFEIVDKIANEHYDGHFTLMRFTTHWKAMFFTPDLDTGKGRDAVARVSAGLSAEIAILKAIVRHYEANV